MDIKSLSDEELLELKEAVSNKVAKHDIFQHSFKILLNSAYGAIGSPYFDWFDLRIAEAVTTGGQLSIKTAINAVNKMGNKITGKDIVRYGDTDSVYFSLEDLVKNECNNYTTEQKVEWIDNFCENVVAKIIDKSYNNLQDYMNCPVNRMDMEREVISETAIWSAKKRYAMAIHDKEGVRYSEPKTKIMGLEVIKSTIPEFFKGYLFDSLVKILAGEDEKEILKIKNDVMKKLQESHPYEFALNSKVNNISKYRGADGNAILKTPQNSKAAIAHNTYLEKNKIKNYPMIEESDSIKIVNMKEPNPVNSDAFGFIDFFPEELLEYIDHDKVFEKGFLKPLSSITNTLNWTLDERNEFDGLI